MKMIVSATLSYKKGTHLRRTVPPTRSAAPQTVHSLTTRCASSTRALNLESSIGGLENGEKVRQENYGAWLAQIM